MGGRRNCQLDFVLMSDTGGSFPLYSSAFHDVLDEQLGHQLRVAEQNSSGVPLVWSMECPRMQRQ